jgi:hypothetical protein
MLHSSDWYLTIFEGIGGGASADVPEGPTPPDGYNAWQAVVGGTASPRSEVIHQVKNQCVICATMLLLNSLIALRCRNAGWLARLQHRGEQCAHERGSN